jgi:Cu(I)/Ag(I) efflux system membrane fusion protein
MYGDVTLHVGAAEAVVIPRDALVDTGELQYVFVAKDRGRFSPRRVRAGWSGDDKVAILEGLAERELVVTSANFLLDSESRLRAALDGPAARARAEAGPREHAGHAGQDDGHTGHHDGRAELAESDAL